MAIAVFRALEGESLEDFSIRLAQQWRIGMKGLDNGAILVVVVNDRKLRLEVGYGLEPVVTDAVAAQIIRDTITPRFREGRYAAGLEAAALGVFDRVGKPALRPAAARPRRASPMAEALPIVIFFGVVLAMIFTGVIMGHRQSVRARRGYTAGAHGWYVPGGSRGWSGGGFSGGGGFGGGGASGSW